MGLSNSQKKEQIPFKNSESSSDSIIKTENSWILITGLETIADGLVATFLMDQGINVERRTGLGVPSVEQVKPKPDLVVLNLDTLEESVDLTVQYAKSLGAPVICTIPVESAGDTHLISELPVDDFIFRPYKMEKLWLRIQVLLKRIERSKALPVIEKRRYSRRKSDRNPEIANPEDRGVRLTIDDRQKLVRLGDREIHLTPKEYDLLKMLAQEPGQVYSTGVLIETLWPKVERASTVDLQQYVHLLRRKIEINPRRPRIIVTVKGFGYKLEIPRDSFSVA